MPLYKSYTDLELIVLLAKDDQQAFELIYQDYSASLYRYAASRLHNPEEAEEVIQDLFVWLWSNRSSLGHIQNLKQYLYSSVRHAIARHISVSIVQKKYEDHFKAFEMTHDNSVEEQINVKDINEIIQSSISMLPDNVQAAFRMSRFEHRSIQEIAQEMQLSTGTVENYITQALKHLRSVLNR